MREFIVEADGGSRGNPGPAGYGAVVSDAATGETLTETAEYLGVATNNVAEYRGLLAGLRAARALDPQARVHVRMDSKLVIEQMTGRWKIKHPAMKPLAAEAAAVLPPERVTYEWIPRERNKHADRLANEAMDAGKRGGTWSPTTSRADLDTPAARPVTPETSGPPGDARAGAARVRAALTSPPGAAAADFRPPAGADTEPGDAATPGATDAGARAAGAGAGSEDGTARSAAGAGAHGAGADAGARAAGAGAASEGAAARTAGAGAGGAGADADARAGGAGAAARGTTGAGVDRAGAVTPVAGADDASGAAGGGRGPAKAEADVRAARAAGAASRTAGGGADAEGRAARAVATPGAGWAPADMGPPATFVLLRHGETPLTPQKRFSGSGGSDPSLSGIGREQAEKVAAALARRGTVQAIVASPLARTRETAGIVAARLGLDVSVEDGLRETDFGAWEGLTFGEVRERHPEDLNAWLASPDAEPTGGGESFAATATRVAATRDKLIAAHANRTVLLVTHVTPIKTFVRLALGAPPEALFRMELSAASLSAVAYYADGNASVRLFNDTSHLRQEG
ncbi:bifunctional RNase H/acid phosphatase [Streptomyces marokkonensis]|uniref:bifunctional RNase H/acid phosphatase n=1 Tax=Streptomyces marokkonensis TaxID=324855 RepID=UPI001AD68B30|nr:bifunctional RNase H/acid phosphatase [Streptomyces marokkonensis]